MPILKIYNEEAQFLEEIKDLNAIQECLNPTGIVLEKWESLAETNFSDNEILKLYEEKINKIKGDYGFQAVDLVSINPEASEKENFEIIRGKFLAEHTHLDDEIRYFISGSGLFAVHHLDKVYALICSAGDFINVPANTLHWFDMGLKPEFKCLRFFTDESGWVAHYTNNPIATRFPPF